MLLVGCAGKQSTEIIVPEIQAGFYSAALSDIDERLENDPSNIKLVEQKLYYCEQTEWPETCLTALNKYRAKHGLTQLIFEQYLTYYTKQNQHNNLIELIDQWKRQYDLDKGFRKPLIESLANVGDRARAVSEIKDFLSLNNSTSDHEFVARQYLTLKDTIMSAYYLGKVCRADSTNEMMLDYGKMLFDLGYPVRGRKVLETYYSSQSPNQDLALDISSFYVNQSEYALSRYKLKPFAKRDSISFFISKLYREDELLDSAIMYLDTVLLESPNNVRALNEKGYLYEEKGWLSTSLNFLEQALAIDSTDTAISNHIALIQRKIAYLQRRKFEEAKRTPVLRLESKKILE